MSSTTLGGIAEKYFTQASEAFSRPETDSSNRRYVTHMIFLLERLSTDLQSSYDNSLRSLKEVYPQFVPRNGEDYPSAVDEDDLDPSIEVLPIRTILFSQGLSDPSAEDCFNIFDDETNFDRCHAVLCDPKESTTQYFINDEDLFVRLNSDSDYFNQHGGDDEREDIEGEQLLEEDILFGSGWDSDETVTDARFLLDIRRKRFHAEEIADIALWDTVPAEDGAKYFDADDLFEREEEEMIVYGRDGWYSEDQDSSL